LVFWPKKLLIIQTFESIKLSNESEFNEILLHLSSSLFLWFNKVVRCFFTKIIAFEIIPIFWNKSFYNNVK
jgi:hypothetical protein